MLVLIYKKRNKRKGIQMENTLSEMKWRGYRIGKLRSVQCQLFLKTAWPMEPHRFDEFGYSSVVHRQNPSINTQAF